MTLSKRKAQGRSGSKEAQRSLCGKGALRHLGFGPLRPVVKKPRIRKGTMLRDEGLQWSHRHHSRLIMCASSRGGHPFPIMRRCPIRLKPNILELFVAGIHCFHYSIEHDETFRNMNLRASSSMCIMRNRKKPSRPGTAFLWALRSGISLCRRARTQASISLTAIGRPLTGTQEHTEHRDLHRNLEARLRSLRRVSPSQRNAFASMTWPSIHPFFTWPFAVYKRMSDLGPNTLAIHEHLVR